MNSTYSWLCALLLGALLTLGAPARAGEAPGAAELERMQQFLGVMQGYYSLIEDQYAVASDQEKSAILQMQKIEEIYKNRGDRAEAITVLRDVLERSQNPTIRNAAAIMLADALNETGRASEAVEVLRSALQTNL